MGDLAVLNRLGGDIPDWLDPDSIARLKRNLAGPGAREHWKHSSLKKTLDALASAELSDSTLPRGLPRSVEVIQFSETDASTREAIRQRLSQRMDWSRYPLADYRELRAGMSPS